LDWRQLGTGAGKDSSSTSLELMANLILKRAFTFFTADGKETTRL
jgi:hypothetical protein